MIRLDVNGGIMRAQMPAFGSDDLVAIELYLAARAKGLSAAVPGVRR